MNKILNNKWIVLLIVVSLISIKFYYLYLSNLNDNYSKEVAYNGGADASHYLIIGKNIADFNVYSDTNSEIISESATWRPPFWPFVLSLFLRFTSNPLALILLKSILEVFLLGYVLFKFKNDLNIKFIYLLPFCFLFIEPQYLKYSITFLSESLTAILILGLIVVFISLNNTKRSHIGIPILAGFVVLCHPVSVFFAGLLVLIYLIYNWNFNRNKSLFHGLLFSLIVFSWPCRNAITFDKGFYLTASQGATLAKGWNEKVSTEFTNSEGDLADEGLNLKYVDPKLVLYSQNSILDLSQLYTLGTKNFIGGIGFDEMAKIALKKLKSNFNPFPETAKPGSLEALSVFFRILYLLVFIQMIVRFFRKGKIDFNAIKDRIYLVILAIFIGQLIMSVYVYTGLRFNAIYSLSLLFCFIYLNMDFLRNKLNKERI
ncbi:hypothetical protein FNW25_12430 [Flavobacterium franklandianum]|uniref:hypothetical protein n=1 Tax=Flavobacterium franklandianum TaxID=2594430 RepID=UPI00117B309F|nr:hypothetical protein [Flavobacterium franklandianum]TRX24100.1 hypothetical protein FNW25_12430 [Flavobacterium franklandianum]